MSRELDRPADRSVSAGDGSLIAYSRTVEAAQVMDRVKEHELPPEVETIVDQYVSVRGSRDPFIWKWVHRLAPEFTFPFVDPAREAELRNVKTVATLFLTLLDDILEKEDDRPTFQEARKVPFPHRAVIRSRAEVDYEYVEFTETVWEWLSEKLETAPGYDRYVDLLRYDLEYSIGAIEYSAITSSSVRMFGLEEHFRRESHNMMMYPYSDMDLMFGIELPPSDVSGVRAAVWHAQRMARIGNWISTWERELREGDYSSGVIVLALEEDVISPADLARIERESDGNAYDRIHRRIHAAGIEEYFLDRWRDEHRELAAINRDLDTVDIRSYVNGMREVLRFHLASRGAK